MLNKIYIKFLSIIIYFIDIQNKKKIINFFKKNLNEKSLIIIDIGAHVGETISLFYNNFTIKNILAFEANPIVFKKLEKKIKKINNKNKISLFNFGIGDKEENRVLSIFNESSSSTYNIIDEKTDYYKRKKFFLSFFSKNIIKKKISTNILPLSKINEVNELKNIDILKIDTEGYELNILKGIYQGHFNKIKYIYFEHHYDLMIKKNYKCSDIKIFLNKNNFYLAFKVKMKFRKTFEYIYENRNK
jgi:FkbM family methyltransferase